VLSYKTGIASALQSELSAARKSPNSPSNTTDSEKSADDEPLDDHSSALHAETSRLDLLGNTSMKGHFGSIAAVTPTVFPDRSIQSRFIRHTERKAVASYDQARNITELSDFNTPLRTAGSTDSITANNEFQGRVNILGRRLDFTEDVEHVNGRRVGGSSSWTSPSAEQYLLSGEVSSSSFAYSISLPTVLLSIGSIHIEASSVCVGAAYGQDLQQREQRGGGGAAAAQLAGQVIYTALIRSISIQLV
jgi:hypothetical protein